MFYPNLSFYTDHSFFKALRFTTPGPFGVSLSALETLMFCHYFGFTIPHDMAGAILYGEVLAGLDKARFSRDSGIYDEPLLAFVDDEQWLIGLIKSMGYTDIVEEFDFHEEVIYRFIDDRFALDGPCDVDVVLAEVESIVPQRYMKIIKKFQ